MSLVIERLHNRFSSDTPLAPERVQVWTAALAAVDGDRIALEIAADDEWLLIRRLSLRLQARIDAPAFELTELWQAALRQALRQAADQPGDGNLLRYTSRRDALADLLYRSAQGERSRQWAWHRMALLPHPEMPAAEALAEAVKRLVESPDAIWPVLHRLMLAEAQTAGLSAVLHALSNAAWQQLLNRSPHTRGHLQSLQAVDAGRFDPAAALIERAAQDIAAQPQACALLAWAARRPPLVRRQRGPLAVLLAGLVRSSAGQPASTLCALMAQAAARLMPSGADSARPSAPLPAVGQALPSSAEAQAQPSVAGPNSPATQPPWPLADRRLDLPPLPDLPDAVEWLTTRWAGALFWLPQLDADALCDASGAADEAALPLRLRAIAQALGVPDDDPAMRAFCGGAELDDRASPALRARAEARVADWSDWLDEAAPDLPAPRLAGVCQRPGRLRFEAGWIEVHLPLDSVQTPIRRLGLDLDPGWLSWLGCVLRICYDA